MADRDVKIKIGAETKDAESALKRTAEELKRTGDAANGASGGADKLSAIFGKLQTGAIALAGGAALGAVVKGLTAVLDAAGEAESVNVKLSAAMKATGQYSAAAAKELDVWSSGLLRSTGLSDELSKSLVANSLTMGLNVEQGKRLVEVATNMAPVVGSVEGAMQMLIRASNGSMQALKRYGVEVTEAETKTGDFEAVLKRVEQQFSGQAVAQLDTYKGQVNLLGEEFGELKETIGSELLPVATSWLSWINDAINKHRILTGEVESLNDAELRRKMLLLQIEKAQAGTLGHYDTDLASVNKQIEALQELMNARGKARAAERAEEAKSGKSTTASSTFANTKSTSTTKKLEESSEMDYKLAAKSAAYQELLKAEAHQSGQSGTASIAETVAEQAFDNSGLSTVFKQSADAWHKETAAATNFGLKLSNLATVTGAAAVEIEGLGNVANPTATIEGSAYDPEQALTDSIVESEEQIAAARKEATAEATVLIAESVEDMAYAIKNNDYGSAARSLGTALEAGFSSLKNAGEYGEIIGNVISSDSVTSALGSVVGGVIGAIYGGVGGAAAGSAAGGALGSLFQETANTAGSQLREKLYDALTDVGFDFDNGGESDASKWTKEALDSSGMAGFWDAMATAVVGDDRIGEGGQILGGAFEGLNLSITETIDAIGSLTASAQNLSEAEGDQIAAAAALLAAQEYTTQELMDIAQQYGDVTNYLERKAELEDEILQDAQDYASATGSKKSEAFAELEKDRAEYLKIISAEAEAQAKSDEELIAALTEKGMSDQDASELVNSQKSAEVIAAKQLTQLEIIAGELAGTPSYHQGTDHIARIRNDEAVVPPEKFSAFSDYLTRSGYGSSGGAQTIVLTLDGKVVTAVVNERNAADKRTRAA